MICTDRVGGGRQDEHMRDIGKVNHKTRQDKTRQDKTTQHNTTQHNTTQHNARQGKGRERKLFDVSDRPSFSNIKKHRRLVLG
jgi:hypothetical protein